MQRVTPHPTQGSSSRPYAVGVGCHVCPASRFLAICSLRQRAITQRLRSWRNLFPILLRHWIDMSARTPFSSRVAALMLAFLAAIHSLVALDLFLNFFPATDEYKAMWGIALWAKILWAAMCVVGAVAAFLLYRRAWLGLLAAMVFCACLYFASLELWGSVKGGFWLAAAATALAGHGAVRVRREREPPSRNPNPALGNRSPSAIGIPFLISSAFTALIGLNCIIYLGAKLILDAPWVGSDALVAVFGAAMATLTAHLFQRYRGLRGVSKV